MVLAKSVFFYVAICLDAFIFCFVGEYLSTKVSMYTNYKYLSVSYAVFYDEKLLLLHYRVE